MAMWFLCLFNNPSLDQFVIIKDSEIFVFHERWLWVALANFLLNSSSPGFGILSSNGAAQISKRVKLISFLICIHFLITVLIHLTCLSIKPSKGAYIGLDVVCLMPQASQKSLYRPFENMGHYHTLFDKLSQTLQDLLWYTSPLLKLWCHLIP